MSLLEARLLAAARQRPDAPLLHIGPRTLTGRDFEALVDSTAQQWQQQGLGAGAFIGWLGHNSAEMLAALLACARLGAVFVPLNWRLAAPELAAIACHAGLSALFNTPELQTLADALRQLAPPAGPAEPARPGDVLLVYTSGTSGSPKGAMHTQAGMAANIDMALAVQGLTAADRVLGVLPMFHVGGLCIQMLPALAAGAQLRLQARFDAAAWLQDVAQWRPSTSLLVPAVMQALLAQPGWPQADLSSLRYVNSGSQVVPLALIQAFHARGVPVTQVYGSTETGPVSIALLPDEALAHPGSVGRPAPGVRLRLMTPAGLEAAPGETGEIQLQAPNLMRGYHRQPPGAGFVDGWFATGDLARADVDADGRITVVGRSQDLIISGGENIHPAEIENLASTWPGVAEAAAVGLPDARWGEVPVLVLVAQIGQTIDLDGLRALFDAQLARFKHPRQILLRQALPRTALGKVQRAQLAASLQRDRPDAQGPAVLSAGLASMLPALLLLALGGGTSAWAQDTGTPQRVTVTGSAAQERRDEVSGKQVISSEALARHGDTRLADALRRVPGLSVGGSGAELQIRLDGMAAEQTLVLLNGEPVPRGQLLEALGLGMIERIEIIRGANVQWSGRGLAGTVNIVITRTPRSAQRDASLALGSYFGQPTGQADMNLGDKQGPHSWHLGLVARADRDRYPVDQRLRFADTAGRVSSAYRAETQESARDEALTATPQWQWAAADGRQLQLNAVLSASQYVGAGDDLRSELQGSPPRLQADRLAYQHQRGFVQMGFKAAWPLADGTRLAASLLASRGRRVQHSVLTGSDFSGAAVRDSAVQSTRVDDVISARGDLQRRLAAEHTLTAGLQLEGNRRQENRVQQERIASWAPDLTDEHYDAASHSLAGFVQDDWLASKATTLSAGVRVEQLQTRSEGNVFDAVRNTYSLASPMLNLLWRPDPGSQWKLGLSRAFRLPEPRDIMPRRWTRPENSSLVPDFVGNPALRPESAWTASAGWDHRLGAEDGAASLALTGVLKRVADIMLDELVLQDGQYLLHRANFGAAWVGSLQAQWQGELAAPWGGPVKLLVGGAARASRLDALPGPDNRLAGQAPWDLRLEADHQPAGSRWAYTAAWRWRAASVAQAPSGRRLGTGQTHSLDLAAAWQQGPASRWRLSVTGLGAPDAADSVVRQWQGGIDSASTLTQQAPRWRAQWLHKF